MSEHATEFFKGYSANDDDRNLNLRRNPRNPDISRTAARTAVSIARIPSHYPPLKRPQSTRILPEAPSGIHGVACSESPQPRCFTCSTGI